MERTVRRADILSDGDTPSVTPDPEDLEKLKNFSADFEFVSQETHQGLQDGNLSDDEQFQFQLFAPPTKQNNQGLEAIKPSAPVQTIRLRSATPPDPSRAGFVSPHRPLSHYLASNQHKDQFVEAALSGQHILSLSRIPQPGNAYPWKVLHLPPSGLARSIRAEETTVFRKLVGKPGKKHCKSGKKTRIQMRSKLEQAQKKAEEKRQELEAKEAQDKAKRSRRNREKKLKKREKERAKKAEARGEAGSQGLDIDMDDSGSEE